MQKSWNYFRKLKTTQPCWKLSSTTSEGKRKQIINHLANILSAELRERLDKASKEVDDGVAIFYTQEEMERMYTL